MAEQRQVRRTFQSQSRQKAVAIDNTANTQRDSLLSSLGKFAEVGADEYSRQQQVKIEESKALGASRAAQDLLVADKSRQGTTEKDTLATKVAYNSIVGQNDTIRAGNDFATWYESNPDADEDAIESKKKELYSPVLKKFGGDKQSLKQVSLQVQESQFKLVGVQARIKDSYTKQKSNEALGVSLDNQLSSPEADLDMIVDTEMPSQAKALGLTEFEMKKSLMETASTRAADGDKRLLDKLNTLDWAKGSAVLDKAQNAYDSFIAREESPAIGNAMGQIELENLSLTVPWSTTLRKIERMNDLRPDTYSAARVASLLKARNAALADSQKKSSGIKSSYNIYHDPSQWPLGSDPAYTSKQRKDIVKDLEANWADKVIELQEVDGLTEDQAKGAVLKDQLKWSRLNRVTIPNLKESIETSLNFSIDEMTNDQLPNYAKSGFGILKQMDATALELYVPSKTDQAFAMNFKKFSQSSENDEQAYRRAMRIKMNPYSVSNEKRTEQRDRMRSEATDRLDSNSWWDFSDQDVELDVPKWQKEQLINRWTDDAETYLYAGGFDTESNANQAIDINMSRMTQLKNGTLTNQTAVDLQRNISQGRELSIDKVPEYIDAHTKKLAPLLSQAYGQEIDMNKVALDFSRTGDTFTILYEGQEQIGGIFLTQDIYDSGQEAQRTKLKGIISEGREEAETNKTRTETRIEEDKAREAELTKGPYGLF